MKTPLRPKMNRLKQFMTHKKFTHTFTHTHKFSDELPDQTQQNQITLVIRTVG